MATFNARQTSGLGFQEQELKKEMEEKNAEKNKD
jgi:hypothetical protein